MKPKPGFSPTTFRRATDDLVLLVNGGERFAKEMLHACATTGAGLRLEYANDVSEAWDYLTAANLFSRRDREQVPSLVVHFPSAFEHAALLERLRDDSRLKRMPFVLLTPGGAPCVRTDALGLGPVIYMPLPVDAGGFESLLTRLRGLLPEV